MKKIKQRKKLNCKQENYACGLKCQPRRYRCPSEKAKEIVEAADKFTEILSLESSNLNKYAKIVKEVKESGGEVPEGITLKDIYVSRFADEDAVEQALEMNETAEINLSKEEANGLSAWLGTNHAVINKLLYMTDEQIETEMDEYSKEYALTAAIRATQALIKVRKELKYTPDTIYDISLAADEDGLRKPYEFSRTLRIKEAKLKEFLEPYEEALSSESGEIVEKTFFSTTASKEKFIPSASVEYIVQAKDDGSTAGVLVDPLKAQYFDEENEILFPPLTKFKVEKIERETVEEFNESEVALISNALSTFRLEDTEEIKKSLGGFLTLIELIRKGEVGIEGIIYTAGIYNINKAFLLEASEADMAKINKLIDKIAKNKAGSKIKIFLSEV